MDMGEEGQDNIDKADHSAWWKVKDSNKTHYRETAEK